MLAIVRGPAASLNMVANITGLENCHVTLLYDVLNLK
jgi:hypothetical protein